MSNHLSNPRDNNWVADCCRQIITAALQSYNLEVRYASRFNIDIERILMSGDRNKLVGDRSLPVGMTRENSIQPDHVTCLFCARKFRSLKRHLRVAHDVTPEQYRKEWDLPAYYPMVAPNYRKMRSRIAKGIGLGKKR